VTISIVMLAWRSALTRDYASDYIISILRNEPNTEIILVDCNSSPPYKPQPEYKLVKVPKPLNIARCMNEGIKAASGDWLLFGNDDVVCSGRFADYVESLDPNTLYGRDVIKKRLKFKGIPWDWYDTVYGWLTIMHRDLYTWLGELDESKPNGGEDIEYSLRATNRGIPIRQAAVPFRHIHDHRRG